MSWTYDWTNFPNQAMLRMMVGDTDALTPIYDDNEVNAALNYCSSGNIIVGLSGFNVAVPQVFSFARGAALLLNSLSAVKARLLVQKVLDVTLQPNVASKALRDLGQSYIDQEASNGYFAVSEMVVNQFSMRERLTAMMLRQQTG